MELRKPSYELTKPKEEDLWVNRSVSHRLWKAGSVGALVGAFSASIASYWYDYPPLKPTDGYRAAAWASTKVISKVTVAFAAASLAYQGTVEIVNAYQERRTALGPFLGGMVGCVSLGMMTKYVKTSLMLGAACGAGAAFFGHMQPFSMSMRYRERQYEKGVDTDKFRYLKNLENREAREAERLAELAALREFQD